MAYFDWDQNGKKDLADDFVEYGIYEELKDSGEQDRGEQDRIGPFDFFCIAMFPFWIVVILSAVFRLFGID